MKKLLLIMGDLATGKSTFANILSQRYDTNLFTKDAIKEILGDTVGFSNRAENLKLSQATAELMCFLFAQFARLDKDLILESNFRIGELEKLHKIASEHDYQVLTLVLQADAVILHKRYLNRMHNENRHPVHLCAQFNTFEGFREYIESLRTAAIPGAVLPIDANDFSYQTAPEVLARIDGFMSGLQLVQTAEEDAKTVQAMQQEAFGALLEKYQDHDMSPATETLEKIRWKITHPGSFYYFIQAEGKTVGGIRVLDLGDGSRKRISPLYILPAHQGKGYAQAAMREAERIHGKSHWQLDTILQEEGNCYLYEKLGYHQTGHRTVIKENMTIVDYEKD